jgi:hypothetical protein
MDAVLRHPLPLRDAEALVALLGGRLPLQPPPHPLFAHPDAAALLVGESLDHATGGSRIVQDAPGIPRFLASASLPPCPALLAAGLSWLGSLLALRPGDVPGFVVPPGMARHDLHLLAWNGENLQVLGPLPADRIAVAEPVCSVESFRLAAGLPALDEDTVILRQALRRVALAQLQGRCLPVAQKRLDGPFRDGQALYRLWMAGVLASLDGLSTVTPPMLVQAA